MPEGKVTLRESAREMAVKRLRVGKTVQNPEVSHMGNKRNAAVLTAQEVCVRIPGVGGSWWFLRSAAWQWKRPLRLLGLQLAKGPEPLSQCIVLSTQLLLMLNDPYFLKIEAWKKLLIFVGHMTW